MQAAGDAGAGDGHAQWRGRVHRATLYATSDTDIRVPGTTIPPVARRDAAVDPVVEPAAERGYLKLFLQTVTQADRRVDFDFLQAPTMIGRVPEAR